MGLGLGYFDLLLGGRQLLSAPFLGLWPKTGSGGWGILLSLGETGFWGILGPKTPAISRFLFFGEFFRLFLFFLKKGEKIR